MILTHLPAAFRKAAITTGRLTIQYCSDLRLLSVKAAKYSVINLKVSSYRVILSMIFLWMRY